MLTRQSFHNPHVGTKMNICLNLMSIRLIVLEISLCQYFAFTNKYKTYWYHPTNIVVLCKQVIFPHIYIFSCSYLNICVKHYFLWKVVAQFLKNMVKKGNKILFIHWKTILYTGFLHFKSNPNRGSALSCTNCGLHY